MYQQNKPAAPDQLNDSQVDIKQNFLEIYNWVAVNHAQFDTDNAGKHTQVTLPNNAAPSVTMLNEMSLFSQASTFATLNGGGTALFFRPPNNGAQMYDMTSAGVQAGPPITGFTRLSSGMLVKFGLITGINANFVYNYPADAALIPVFTANPVAVIVTPFLAAGNAAMPVVSNNGVASFTLTLFNTAGNPVVAGAAFYVAIGY